MQLLARVDEVVVGDGGSVALLVNPELTARVEADQACLTRLDDGSAVALVLGERKHERGLEHRVLEGVAAAVVLVALVRGELRHALHVRERSATLRLAVRKTDVGHIRALVRQIRARRTTVLTRKGTAVAAHAIITHGVHRDGRKALARRRVGLGCGGVEPAALQQRCRDTGTVRLGRRDTVRLAGGRRITSGLTCAVAKRTGRRVTLARTGAARVRR